MKYEYDYSIEIKVKDQFGMDVYSISTNPDDLQSVLQEMDEAIEQYDKDLGYVAHDEYPKEEEKEEVQQKELEREQPVIITPRKSSYYERKSIKATAK